MKDKKAPLARNDDKAKKPEPPAEEPAEGGQHTIFNVPPSRFEQLVDEVLKKHKL